MKRVMVLGLSGEPEVRKSFEASASHALQQAGVEAVPASTELASSGTPSKEDVRRAVEQTKVDGVWVSRLVGTDKKTTVVPGEVYRPLDSYVSYGYDAVYRPGYAYQYEVVQVETKLFEKDSGRMLWSGLSETENTGSVNDLIKSMSNAVVQDLKRKGLVAGAG
jgi:hypothetical protein